MLLIKGVIAILDNELSFAIGFMNYMNETQALGTKAVAFTEQEALTEYVKEVRIAILLASKESLVEGLELIGTKVIYLSSSRNDKGQKDTIYKYQSAEQLIQDIRQLIKEMDQLETFVEVGSKGSDRRVAVYSFGSVISSTVFSIGISNYFAGKGKTLYLNLDPYSILQEEVLGGDGKGLTDILYYLRQGEKDVLGKGNLVKSLEGISHIAPMQHYGDLNSMEMDDIEVICKQAIDKLDCRTVVIHITEMNAMVEHYLQSCDTVFLQPNYYEVLDDRIHNYRRMLESSFLSQEAKVKELPFLDTNQLSRQTIRDFIFHNGEFYQCIKDLMERE